MLKKRKAPTSPLLGSTLAKMLKAKGSSTLTDLEQGKADMADLEKGPEGPVELPSETDPDILEAQRAARRKAKNRRGLASTILTGSLGDEGYSSGTMLG